METGEIDSQQHSASTLVPASGNWCILHFAIACRELMQSAERTLESHQRSRSAEAATFQGRDWRRRSYTCLLTRCAVQVCQDAVRAYRIRARCRIQRKPIHLARALSLLSCQHSHQETTSHQSVQTGSSFCTKAQQATSSDLSKRTATRAQFLLYPGRRIRSPSAQAVLTVPSRSGTSKSRQSCRLGQRPAKVSSTSR